MTYCKSNGHVIEIHDLGVAEVCTLWLFFSSLLFYLPLMVRKDFNNFETESLWLRGSGGARVKFRSLSEPPPIPGFPFSHVLAETPWNKFYRKKESYNYFENPLCCCDENPTLFSLHRGFVINQFNFVVFFPYVAGGFPPLPHEMVDPPVKRWHRLNLIYAYYRWRFMSVTDLTERLIDLSRGNWLAVKAVGSLAIICVC